MKFRYNDGELSRQHSTDYSEVRVQCSRVLRRREVSMRPTHTTHASKMLSAYFFAATLIAGTQASLAFKGVDWSSLLVEEASGYTYKTTSGTTEPLETILKSSGVNTVRQRLWVNPSNGDYNLAYNIKLATRAHAAGLNVYLDMMFSDTWTDPGHQVGLSLDNVWHFVRN